MEGHSTPERSLQGSSPRTCFKYVREGRAEVFSPHAEPGSLHQGAHMPTTLVWWSFHSGCTYQHSKVHMCHSHEHWKQKANLKEEQCQQTGSENKHCKKCIESKVAHPGNLAQLRNAQREDGRDEETEPNPWTQRCEVGALGQRLALIPEREGEWCETCSHSGFTGARVRVLLTTTGKKTLQPKTPVLLNGRNKTRPSLTGWHHWTWNLENPSGRSYGLREPHKSAGLNISHCRAGQSPTTRGWQRPLEEGLAGNNKSKGFRAL